MPGFQPISGFTADGGGLPAGSRQLLVVTAADWSATRGQLQCFVRGAEFDAWQPDGLPVPVSLGRSGLAWGRGLHPAAAHPRRKQEGDGCAPAGVFVIGPLFGEADELARLPGVRMPFLSIQPSLKAVDDPASAHYNRIVDATAVVPDWDSCEEMRRDDMRYLLGAVVGHNPPPAVAGAGSCIFLHVWENAAPTAGCTAMALADMRRLAGWLDAAAQPLLVQLPAEAYAARQADWGLPALMP